MPSISTATRDCEFKNCEVNQPINNENKGKFFTMSDLKILETAN